MHDHHDAPGVGHNHGPRQAAQWQVPHRPPESNAAIPDEPEPDFDLVETAFAEGFATASDPTSSASRSRPDAPTSSVPAAGRARAVATVLTPHIGGGSFRYDPLPAKLVSRRRRLRLIYHDGSGLQPLNLGDAKGLAPADGEPWDQPQ